MREAVVARTERIAGSLGGTPEARLLVRGVIGMLEAAAIHTLEQDDVEPDALAELLTQVIWAGVSSLDGTDRAGRSRSESEVGIPERRHLSR